MNLLKKTGALPDQGGEAKGEEEVVEEFKRVYEKLYNSLDDNKLLEQLKRKRYQKR